MLSQQLLNKTMLLLCRSHSYKNSRIVITNWLTVDNGSFPFYVDFVFPLSPLRLLPDLNMSNTPNVFLLFASTWVHSLFLVASVFCSSSFYFSVLCFSVLFCILCPMLPVSRECLFLLAIMIFCHAYLSNLELYP